MVAHAYTVAFQGVEAREVDVQCHLTSGLPAFNLVGLPDKAVAESKERVRSALAAIGLALPPKRITVNLAPADLPKEGAHFDLPIALSLLAAMEVVPADETSRFTALGELSLDGSLTAVAGALPAALSAAMAERGIICPRACGPEAALVGAVQVLAPDGLTPLINHFAGRGALAAPKPAEMVDDASIPDLIDVKGQERARRAMEVAAAGSHNLFRLWFDYPNWLHLQDRNHSETKLMLDTTDFTLTTDTKPRAYSYIRFSTPEQALGTSLQRQLDASREFADRHGLELDETSFRDLGTSAYRGANATEGALGEFLRAVDEGRVSRGSFLLVERLDRLSRDRVLEALGLLQRIVEKGVNVATLSDGRVHTKENLERDFGQLMATLMSMYLANEESAKKGERVGKAWALNRQAARETDRKLTAKCPAWLTLNAERRSFTVDEHRAEAVRRIFQMTLAGYGAVKIARTFNDEEVPTLGRSNGWQKSTITKVLTSEAVIGVFQPHRRVIDETGKKRRVPDGEPIKDYFPAIVDRETFLRAKDARASRFIGGGRKGDKFSNLFTGLVKCGICGGAMHFANKGPGEHYLTCTNAKRHVGECKAPSWRYRAAELAILLSLTEVDYGELFPDAMATRSEVVQRLSGELLVLEQDYREIRGQIARLVDALAKRPDSDALLDRLDEIETKGKALKAQIEERREELEREERRVREASQVYSTTQDGLQKLAEVTRQRDPDKLYRVRANLNQLLKRSLSEIAFHPLKGAELSGHDVRSHGLLEIRFAGVSERVRRVWLSAKQDEGYSVAFAGDGEDGERRYFRIGKAR